MLGVWGLHLPLKWAKLGCVISALFPLGPVNIPSKLQALAIYILHPKARFGVWLAHAAFDALPTELSSCRCVRAQELCESGGGHPGLPVPNSQYGLCGRQTTLNRTELCLRAQELCRESRGGPPGLPVPNSP